MRGTSTSELFSASADPAISFEDTIPNLNHLFSFWWTFMTCLCCSLHIHKYLQSGSLAGLFRVLINRRSYFTVTTLKSLNVQKNTCKLFVKNSKLVSQLITYVSFIHNGYKLELRKVLLILKQLLQSDKSCCKIRYFSPTVKRIYGDQLRNMYLKHKGNAFYLAHDQKPAILTSVFHLDLF